MLVRSGLHAPTSRIPRSARDLTTRRELNGAQAALPRVSQCHFARVNVWRCSDCTTSLVQSDDTILVTGASGGVGSAAVQLAKAYGARTIAVQSAAKRERLVELGADATVDRSVNIARELGANSVDVIVDAVAGPTLPSLFELL